MGSEKIIDFKAEELTHAVIYSITRMPKSGPEYQSIVRADAVIRVLTKEEDIKKYA